MRVRGKETDALVSCVQGICRRRHHRRHSLRRCCCLQGKFVVRKAIDVTISKSGGDSDRCKGLFPNKKRIRERKGDGQRQSHHHRQWKKGMNCNKKKQRGTRVLDPDTQPVSSFGYRMQAVGSSLTSMPCFWGE